MSSSSPAPSSMSFRRPLRRRPPPPPTEEQLDAADHFRRLRPTLAELPELIGLVNTAEDVADGVVDPTAPSNAADCEAALVPYLARLEEALSNHLARYPADKNEHRGTFELCLLASALTRDLAQLAPPNPTPWALDIDVSPVSRLFSHISTSSLTQPLQLESYVTLLAEGFPTQWTSTGVPLGPCPEGYGQPPVPSRAPTPAPSSSRPPAVTPAPREFSVPPFTPLVPAHTPVHTPATRDFSIPPPSVQVPSWAPSILLGRKRSRSPDVIIVRSPHNSPIPGPSNPTDMPGTRPSRFLSLAQIELTQFLPRASPLPLLTTGNYPYWNCTGLQTTCSIPQPQSAIARTVPRARTW